MVKLSSRELELDKTENKSENLDEDITELLAMIASKETEIKGLPAGTRKNEEISIDLDTLRARLRRFNFRKTETVSALSIVEKNISTGQAQLMLAYYNELKTALDLRKAQL